MTTRPRSPRAFTIYEDELKVIEEANRYPNITECVRSRPHQPAAPSIQIEGIDGEMIDLLADDKEIYLDSFAKFANNPAVDMIIQMFRDKQSLRSTSTNPREHTTGGAPR